MRILVASLNFSAVAQTLARNPAGVTEQSFQAIGRRLAADIERLRRGEPPRFMAN